MALLDQLFRLRGAPRAAHRAVTLGALVAALKEDAPVPAKHAAVEHGSAAASSVPENPDLPSHGGSRNEPGDGLPGDCGFGNEQGTTGGEARKHQIPSDLGGSPVAGNQPNSDSETATAIPVSRRDESPSGQRRNAIRFNPFGTSTEGRPKGPADPPIAEKRGAPGPCLDDPALPPLRLEAQVVSDAGDRPVVLGAAAVAESSAAPAPLQQIEAPAVRLAPVKAPARALDPAPSTRPRPLLLRLEIQAEAFLDVVAFKQHAAKFPGVVKCVISNARD